MIEYRDLSTAEALQWVAGCGLPGLPCERQAIEFEDRSNLTSYTLARRFDIFTLSARKGVAITDGEYYAHMDGEISNLILTHPGSAYPFSDRHTALRYTAEGKHYRRGDFGRHREVDAVRKAADGEIALYCEQYRDYPSPAEYTAAMERVVTTFGAGGIYGSIDQEEMQSYVADLWHKSQDLAIKRACMVLLEDMRVSEVVAPVMLLSEANQKAIDAKNKLALIILVGSIVAMVLSLIAYFVVVSKQESMSQKDILFMVIIQLLPLLLAFAFPVGCVWALRKLSEYTDKFVRACSFEYHYAD